MADGIVGYGTPFLSLAPCSAGNLFGQAAQTRVMSDVLRGCISNVDN